MGIFGERHHHAALTDDQSVELLTGAEDDTVRQHLAILHLTTIMSDQDTYRIVTDPATAEDTALEAIEAGDIGLLSAVLTAATELQNRPISWNLAAAVLLLAEDQPEQALEVAELIAREATPLQRRAHTIRLRALQTHHPDLPGLDDVIEVIDPKDAPTLTAAPSPDASHRRVSTVSADVPIAPFLPALPPSIQRD